MTVAKKQPTATTQAALDRVNSAQAAADAISMQDARNPEPTNDPAKEIGKFPTAEITPPKLPTLSLLNRERVLGVKMRVDYGAVQMEFEVAQLANPQTVAEQNTILDMLTAQLEHAHDLFAEHRLPKLRDRGTTDHAPQKKLKSANG